MLLLWVTKVFHRGLPRVGRISKNIALPRSVPLPILFAVPVGAMLGYIASGLLRSMFSWLPFIDTLVRLLIILGVGILVILVTAQPWRGEYVHRVAAVKTTAFATAKVLMCPGSSMPSVRSDESGTFVCGMCGQIFGSSEIFTPPHQWRRRVYLGMKPIPPPITGEVEIIAGSVPTYHNYPSVTNRNYTKSL